MGRRLGFGDMDQFTMTRSAHNVMAIMIGLQGLLLVVGDVGCYLAWHCTKWLAWHGYLGMCLLATAVISWMFFWIKDHVAKH